VSVGLRVGKVGAPVGLPALLGIEDGKSDTVGTIVGNACFEGIELKLDCVGLIDGRLLGISEGTVLGSSDGISLGKIEGITLLSGVDGTPGAADSELVGLWVGSGKGLYVASIDCDALGAFEVVESVLLGFKEGSVEICVVGPKLGEPLN
jgi:hypothetical protein